MTATRRGVVLGAGAALASTAARASEESLKLSGRWVQGGFAMGRTWPRARILVDGEALSVASGDGQFFVGFDRDAAAGVEIEVRPPPGVAAPALRRTLAIAPGRFPTSAINGLPAATIAPSDPALLARIRQESVLKMEGFASRSDGDDFRDGFVWPLDSYRVTSLWGSQRVLNGTPARPHYGIDLAAPQGTPIRAPAAGIVTLARPGLHFEGGLVLIDHGQGLVTAYLHQSRIDVVAGQRISRGQTLGRVGMTGRATGPHLCWRMKWRDRNLDPSLMVTVTTPISGVASMDRDRVNP